MSSAAAPMFSRVDQALHWEQDGEILRIEPWGRDSLRLRATRGPALRDDLPGALLPQAECRAQISITSEQATLVSGAISARISAAGQVTFFRTASGEILLREPAPRIHLPPARHYRRRGGSLYRSEVRFAAHDDERFYGLGQHQHGRLDQKGCVIELLQRNTEVCIPFLLSSRGYGFLWNNPAVGRVELAANGTRWVAAATAQLDYWVTTADTPADILERYVDATGHAPLLPEWAAGFWQSKLRYRTQAELLEVAREYHRRGLPLDIIVIDFFHWTCQGDWQFNPTDWPDPAAMVQELEQLGVRPMVSIWPTATARSRNFSTMRRQGLFVATARGVPAHMPFIDTGHEGTVYVHFYDPTHPAGRKFIWEQVRQGYHQHGIKLWWLDACEPEMYPMDPDNLQYHAGDGLSVTNLYPQMHARAFFEGMRAAGEEEIVTLCRSAWAGSQRYGAAVWSGDIPSTFDALRRQISAGLSIGLSGIPWWTTDIGGFHGGDPQSPEFRELIIRWFQYGAFCPLFRLHGVRRDEGPNEVWSFGDEAYLVIRTLLLMRERLRPYIMKQMRRAHETGMPPMRPLFLDFPKDTRCWTIDDQFMFGPELLVAPILSNGMREREVYLPAGETWTDPRTGTAMPGGQWVTSPAPLAEIPLFLRGTSHLPLQRSE